MSATVEQYQAAIVQLLTGEAREFQDLAPERLDWAGVSGFLALYDEAAGDDRRNLIDAMGRLIEKADAPEDVVAQVIDLAISLNVSQVEPSVHKLRETLVSATQHEPIQGAIRNFMAYRQLQRGGSSIAARFSPPESGGATAHAYSK